MTILFWLVIGIAVAIEFDEQWVIDIRRSLHRIPELGFKEFKTHDTLRGILDEIKVNYTTGWGTPTGIVGMIGTGEEPCIALRADMDALPIQEMTNVPYESTHPGRMHACGHDAHMAMLLGAAKILKDAEDKLKGTIKLIFQPAEEGGGGAFKLREAGVLAQYPQVKEIYGLHVWPGLKPGAALSRAGPVLAAAINFKAVIQGNSGHAAMPHLTRDPLPAAASAIQAIYQMVARRISSVDEEFAGLVSISSIRSDQESYNVISKEIVLKGTIRAMTKSFAETLEKQIIHILENTAQMNDLNYAYAREGILYPALYNSKELFESAKSIISEIGVAKPFMASEDFAFYCEEVECLFLMLGVGHKFPLHNPKFNLDEKALPKGAEMLARLARERLNILALHDDKFDKEEL